MKAVAGKDLLVKVNVITPSPASVLPNGSLVVSDATGAAITTLALNKPTGPVSSTLPAKPNMSLAYTATVPASAVRVGIKLAASLAGNGQAPTEASPAVQAAPHIRIVAVPFVFADDADGTPGKTGKPLPASHVNAAFLDRAPLAQVTYEIRTTPIALDFARNAPGSDPHGVILNRVNLERTNDQDKSLTLFYSGVHYSPNGGGLGYVPGFATSLGDWDGNADALLGTFLHEHGHNFSLSHVPACMGTSSYDTNYPYAGGMLGDASRAITTYFMSQGLGQTLIDPTTQTDRMGYCFPAGRALSDYSYMKAFDYLQRFVPAKEKAAPVRQDLIYIAGVLHTNGAVTLHPVEALTGVPETDQAGDWQVRVTATSGRVYTYPLELKVLDHAPERHFSIAIPDPGQVLAIEVVNAQKQVVKRQATSLAKASSTRSANVQWREADGRLVATWDAQAFTHVTVSWVKDGRSTTLTNPRQGGRLSVDTRTLGQGGEFEFSLSDGLNTKRLRYRR